MNRKTDDLCKRYILDLYNNSCFIFPEHNIQFHSWDEFMECMIRTSDGKYKMPYNFFFISSENKDKVFKKYAKYARTYYVLPKAYLNTSKFDDFYADKDYLEYQKKYLSRHEYTKRFSELVKKYHLVKRSARLDTLHYIDWMFCPTDLNLIDLKTEKMTEELRSEAEMLLENYNNLRTKYHDKT